MTPKGLTTSEAKKLLLKFGSNEIVQAKKLSAFFDFLSRFKNPLIGIFVVAAFITGIFGDITSATLIIVMILMSVVLDFVNTHKSQRAAESLKKKVMITATVLRDGKEIELPLAHIVPSDIVKIHPGDVIPADCEVIESKDFFVNESSLTGESFPAERVKGEAVYMGSSAVTGEAVIEVRATGTSTKFSHIAEALIKKGEETEFDRSIREFSVLVMRITFALVVFIFFINAFIRHTVLESFLFAAALAVGLTPELLPMIIALNLSKGSLDMSKHGVIVKKLSAIQNFGSMDVLCTDKTGTLTEDKISLVKYLDWHGEQSEEVLFYSYLSSSFTTGFHNPLDAAVKEFAKLDISAYKKIDEIPFDYVRKRDSIVVEGDGKRILISKGAPEEILKISGSLEDASDSAIGVYHSLSSDGFRVLGVAIKEVRDGREVYSKDDESGMKFLGFIAFLDPPKKTVEETLKILEAYGVEIKVLTGDNELVSQKIARDLSLPLKGILFGSDIEHMTNDELRIKVEGATLFVRVSPDEKERIIHALKNNGHVVGYLGDGINDAPPLKAADVSISVSNAVDVAKDTADLILIKKSLRDLIEGVIEGRKTLINTLKYLMMDLSSNFGNMFSMAGASLVFNFFPMLPTQIILNNLIYDSSQLTIPTDSVDEEYVRKPRRLSAHFLERYMLFFGPVSSVFDFITFFVLAAVFNMSGHAFQTGWFLESIMTQTFVVYIIRTRKVPFFKSLPSKALAISTIGAVCIAWIIAYSSFGTLLHFVAIGLAPALAIVGITLAYLFVTEFAKSRFYSSKRGAE